MGKYAKAWGDAVVKTIWEKKMDKFEVPWHGAYKTGVWFCDFQAVTSGAGGFGNAARRAIAKDAFYDIMSETKAIACAHSTKGSAAVTNDVEASDAPEGKKRL